jgi:hypothetical protein
MRHAIRTAKELFRFDGSAANRKPIAGARAVKVVANGWLHYYLPGQKLVGAGRKPGSLETWPTKKKEVHQ